VRPLVTAEEMRAADRQTIDDVGLPAALLMELAGRAVAEVVLARSAPGARVAVACGGGNNGGDGFACARWLREAGRDARVILARGAPRSAEAALHLAAYRKLGGPVLEEPGFIDQAEVIVDALLGNGTTQVVTGPIAAAIARINAARGLRVAVDLPSGLASDDGRVLGEAVRADVTVALAVEKIGTATFPGCALAGEVIVADIGIPVRFAAAARAFMLEEADARALTPRRELGAHKGSHGHVLVAAGSRAKVGAALLAATGALRGGAGLVTLAVPPDAAAAVIGRVPEVMLAELDPEAPGAEQVLEGLALGKRAVVLGPGMPTSAAAGALVRRAAASLAVPMVLDADALNHLAAGGGRLRDDRVLTPHPGEAARLLSGARVEDRIGAARAIAARTGAVVCLKGARTVVAAPDGIVSLNPTGNPGLGTGGTGDVLAGLAGALLAQGLAALDAARLAVYLHGLAGDLAVASRGPIGIVAGDVAAELPRAFARLAEPAGQGGNRGRVQLPTNG
jgi:NAD(P)H-hydrate epimerase